MSSCLYQQKSKCRTNQVNNIEVLEVLVILGMPPTRAQKHVRHWKLSGKGKEETIWKGKRGNYLEREKRKLSGKGKEETIWKGKRGHPIET